MKYWTEYRGHDVCILGKKKRIDNTIYTFDIETTSYLILDGRTMSSREYPSLSSEEQEDCVKQACMYVWQFSIEDQVYYGRTWIEFKLFLDKITENDDTRKILFIHNLGFEFQALWSVIRIKSVMSRKSRKLMTAQLEDYDIELRCTMMMSNAKLEKLPDLYQLPVRKKVGDLDYNKLRTPATPLTEQELGYCEFDCLVTYWYVKTELETYGRVDKIPITSTGKVRKQLQHLVLSDPAYVRKVSKQINTEPKVYNMLVDAFAGGYTHANYIYADDVLPNVDSYDETSAYPYVLVTCKFPSSEFKKCWVKSVDQMLPNFAYLLKVKLNGIKSKYYNHFISTSKCNDIEGYPRYDNGRIISAKSATITCTDIDLRFFLDAYNIESYEIIESYYASYAYLPIEYVNFILDKYVLKTKLKNVEGKELEYNREKANFNAIYGMTVTNDIRSDVEFVNFMEWIERPISNAEIMKKLGKKKKRGFLNFAWGVWCTAYARDNLLRRVLDLDEYVVYCDTDSCKLVQGYDKTVFEMYNQSVEEKIRKVCKVRGIAFERYAPSDIKGIPHLLGVFECETGKGRSVTYDKFITQGAKKYAYELTIPKDSFKSEEELNKYIKDHHYNREDEDNFYEIHVTVSGVPKAGGAKCLKSLDEFKDDLVFDFANTNKLTLFYNDNQESVTITDYLGNDYTVTDKSGICMLPTTYKLGKAFDYMELICDESSERAKFR